MFRLFIILSRKPFFGSGGGGGGGAAASSAAISATAATPPSTAIGVRDRGSSNDTLTLASDTQYVSAGTEKSKVADLKINYDFNPPPHVIYESLLDTERIRGVTASDASMSKEVISRDLP